MQSKMTDTKWAWRAVGFLTGMACVVTWAQAPEPLEPPPLLDADDFNEIFEDINPELRQQLERALGERLEMRVGEAIVEERDLAVRFAARGHRVFGGRVDLASGRVKTDTDAETLLERAEAFAKLGRYDLASQLWQQALEQSSDALIERSQWRDQTLSGHTYHQLRPMFSEIEASMARTIRGGLEAYRLKVDGDARALLARARPEARESALAEIILRYFLSSIGDDAAFELACVKMERGEFLPSVRLLAKILDEYPDSSIERPAVEVRLAGALARVGNVPQALEMVDGLMEEFPERGRILTLVRRDIEAFGPGQGSASLVDANVTTPPGVQRSLPAALPASLKVAWTQHFDLTLPQHWPVLPESPRDPLPKLVDPNQNVRRDQVPRPKFKPVRLTHRWRAFFMPTGQVLAHGGRLYFKTDDRVVACETDTGVLQWSGFRNSLVLDENTKRLRRPYRTNAPADASYPATPEEFLLFGESVHQSMTLAGDVLYVLQGNPLDFDDQEREMAPAPGVRHRRIGGRIATPGRFRDNRLVAYDAVSGKVKWYRRASDPVGEGLPIGRRAGFSRAPLVYGSLLLVPIHEEAALWLVGLDRDTGATRWRTFLCDEPPGGCRGTAAISMTVDAGEAYVGSGAGLIFSIDAVSGNLNWALRHPRTMKRIIRQGSLTTPVYTDLMNLLDGWHEDRVVAHGSEVIVTGTDFNHLFAVNRRTGKLAWETARQPFRSPDPSKYLLAAHGGRVFVAGGQTVRCFRARGGKMIWEMTLPSKSFARGAFTPKAIYMPLHQSVIQLDPETGATVAQAEVLEPFDDEPIGNLFTDGERLIVFGLKKVYALAPAETNENLSGRQP